MTILEILFQRCKANSEARGLLDKAVAEGRSLTIPEQVRFDSLLASVSELDAALDARAALRRIN